MLWYRYILFDWDKSFLHPTPSRKLHERFYTPPLHASYWTFLHPTPPHPTPRMTHAWQVQENLH